MGFYEKQCVSEKKCRIMFAKEIKKMVPIDYVSINYKTWMSESAGITTCSVNVAPEGQFFLSPNPHECFAKYSKYKK